MTNRKFEIFSRTTGHSFGEWEAASAAEAFDRMETQIEIDRSDLEALLVVTDDDIRKLGEEAHQSGDYPLRAAAYRALGEGHNPPNAADRAACVSAIRKAYDRSLD